MYIWNVNALIKDIKDEKLSQKEQFKYALSYSLLIMIMCDPLLYAGEKYSYVDAVQSLLLLIVSAFGIYACYRANSRADDKDFVLRFFTIGLPVSLRFIAVGLPIALLMGAIEGFLMFDSDTESESMISSISSLVFSSAFIAAFYFYFQSKFRLFGSFK